MAWHSEIELAGVGDVREIGMKCLSSVVPLLAKFALVSCDAC